ncbi:MAG: hypothetical protein KGN32_10765 [Burkholderiales bacterium]|nr:hypothetical protein [Burkholderiales bacterium]
MNQPANTSSPSAPGDVTQSLLAALDALLEPLAQLCVGKGVPIQAVEERLRHAFVKAAHDTCEGANSQRLNSRISALTGLTRREVTRIEALAAPARPATRSALTELFTRWMTIPPYCGPDGAIELPRHGEEPSFDSLASSVTRDVHPRSLLDALCRLGLAEQNPTSDTVRLSANAFVPRNQWAQMVGFLGENVGDHLRAAVTNVLGRGNEHFEQSLYADELSTESLQIAQQIVANQWKQLMKQVAPQLEGLMRTDALAGRPQDQCLRLGLYSWMQAMTPQPQTTPVEAPSRGE